MKSNHSNLFIFNIYLWRENCSILRVESCDVPTLKNNAYHFQRCLVWWYDVLSFNWTKPQLCEYDTRKISNTFFHEAEFLAGDFVLFIKLISCRELKQVICFERENCTFFGNTVSNILRDERWHFFRKGVVDVST